MDGPTLAPDRFSGKKLGKYEVLCRLSTGGMAEIYLAFHRGVAGFRKLVVLKKILPEIDEDEDIVRMFVDEARLTAQFNHPHIAQVYDLDSVDGELFLAMEFVPGATLIEVAQATRKIGEAIPIGFTLAVCRDTALALHYAHTFKDPLGRPRQVIHRDVAEKNIMVTYEGTTKLLDFGIAKAQGRMTATAVGKVKGTSGYMSPEQVVGEELDARSDIFSLGIVMHECLTGMRLFYGKDAEAGMMAALNQTPAAPSEANPEVGRELDQVVLKALARKREDRYESALEFARAIEKAGGNRLWNPERIGMFTQRLFKERREQTRVMMEGTSITGEIDLQAIFRASKEAKDRDLRELKEKETTAPLGAPIKGQTPAEAAAYELLKSVAQPAPPSPPAARSAQLPAMARPPKSSPDLRSTLKHQNSDEDEETVINPRAAAHVEDDEDAAERTIPVEVQGGPPSADSPARQVRKPAPIPWTEPPKPKSHTLVIIAVTVAVIAVGAGIAYYLGVF